MAKAANAPAKLKGLRRARNLRVGLRAITMLRAICDQGCQDGDDVPHDWYLECPHDPYIGVREKRVQVPIYSDEQEDGSRVLERMEERVTWEPWPNFVDVIHDLRVNSGNSVERGRRRGWILPEELRNELYPNGIAPMCQFKGCRWQDGLKKYRYGTFCREMEARLVTSKECDPATGNLIHGAMEVHQEGKRMKMLQELSIA